MLGPPTQIIPVNLLACEHLTDFCLLFNFTPLKQQVLIRLAFIAYNVHSCRICLFYVPFYEIKGFYKALFVRVGTVQYSASS